MNARGTLLGHLVPKLTVQVENAATEALAFILNKSENGRRALEGLLSGPDFQLEPISRLTTQVTLKDRRRPDMAGYDRRNAMRLMVESKFWADLGDGQACSYLGHLQEEGELQVLLFIVPDSRLSSLWTDINDDIETGRRCSGGPCGPLVEFLGSEPIRTAKVSGSDKRVMATGWSHLLEVLSEATSKEDPAGAEVVQLQGLVDYMARDNAKAFAPLTAEELKPAIPARMLSLRGLVDDTVNAAQDGGWATGAKRKSEPRGGGYGKYFYLRGAYVWFGVYWRLWAQYGESPLWVWPWEEAQRALLRSRISSPDGNHFPVNLPIEAGYQTVLQETLDQLEKMGQILEEQVSTDNPTVSHIPGPPNQD